jgi:uncharacterized protein YdeI (YjbR/CyaY-like superfamily)
MVLAEPTFFASAAAFGRWLDRHSQSAGELIVGFHKVDSGRPSMRWPESVDEALCRGWIDGVRKRIDEHSYQIRFTPRKPTSTWSAINIARVAALTDEGRMTAAGLAAFTRRMEHKSKTYAYEQAATSALSPAHERLFREHASAWAFFEAQAPSYRKRMLWRVVSAQREATRTSRLAALIEASGRGERL